MENRIRIAPISRFNAARGFVGGAAMANFFFLLLTILFQCRTRLCGWCSSAVIQRPFPLLTFQCRTRLCGWCSMDPIEEVDGILGFQCRTRLCGWCSRSGKIRQRQVLEGFQCRTRLCGWCSSDYILDIGREDCFNAARGFVGGAASSLSALFPLGRKSPFGKSPEI